ncbi:MAG: thiamine phosphate synthase [Sandaracinaceae bacterium]
MTRGRPLDLRVYVVTDPEGSADVAATVEAALRGGARTIQIRDKHAPDGDLIDLAARLAPAVRRAEGLLILNDRLEAATRAAVDGVHLGAEDRPVREARRLLGPDAVIGWSARDRTEAEATDPALVDYCGLGPVYPTSTKPDAAPALGIDAFRDACSVCRVPVVGIGGIDASNAAAVIRAGAVGVAVVTAVSRAADPRAATEGLARAVRGSAR